VAAFPAETMSKSGAQQRERLRNWGI